MNAIELIKQINEYQNNNWKNSDLNREVEILLEQIKEHYEKCEECRDSFNDMNYIYDTLKEMENIFVMNLDINLWICE